MKSTLLVFLTVLAACTVPKSDQKESATAPGATRTDEAVIIGVQQEPDTLKGSLEAKAVGKIGGTSISIRYHSPAVRERIVWGGLVPFDRVWVTGAHMATSIDFDHDVSIGGVPVPAGKYAYFTIPGRDSWILILNSNWQQHLTDEYDSTRDIVRVNVNQEQVISNQERLRYVIEATNDKEGKIVVYWEKISIPLKVNIAQ